jgi:putative glycosyltransferase (TIGR04372 family)
VLSFTPEEHRAAAAWLEKHVVPEKYVTFLARDSAYNEKVHPYDQTIFLHQYRNVDVAAYVPAMKWLAGQGGGSLRMGKVVGQELGLDLPGVLDYANMPDRSDFLDIYLFAHSAFTVTCGSGPDAVPELMDRPMLLANGMPLLATMLHTNYRRGVLAVKPIWSREKNKILSFREILSAGLGLLDRTQDYQAHGLELLTHDPEEMLAMVREMYARFVAETWVVTDEEKQLQARFKKLLAEFLPGLDWRGGLAFSYYRANPHFLADA